MFRPVSTARVPPPLAGRPAQLTVVLTALTLACAALGVAPSVTAAERAVA